MCGIWGIFGYEFPPIETIQKCIETLSARGPEYFTIQEIAGSIMGFTRLAINGLALRGNQPISAHGWTIICNGEIYNYKELASKWDIDLPENCSDCEILPYLFSRLNPTEIFRALDGVFAIMAINEESNKIIIGRDPYGVRPLFIANEKNFNVISSEIKGLVTISGNIHVFEPGTWKEYYGNKLINSQKYHHIPWIKNPVCDSMETSKYLLKTSFEKAIEKRLLSERPIGALLSGGLDSSLVCAVLSKFLRVRGKPLHTFSIGMAGSTDLKCARIVADYIESRHHEIIMTKQDFFDAIPEVIRSIESYDTTTVRASVGNWLIAKYIRENTDIKVVFNGDGSDEIGGGYLYFARAPSDEEFESEIERLLKDIHMFDVLRSDRCMAAHGLEPRTPFLDKQFVSIWRSIPTNYLRDVEEKYILRASFIGYLPREILWRKKEAFSDGVSSAEEPWHASINKYAIEKGYQSEKDMYKQIFIQNYGVKCLHVIPYMWMPKWSPETSDPSARTLSIYKEHR
jgi:asparagine synthase (glutamine-hydrolysing)